jgi:cytochrome c biogenesis protein
MSRIALDSLKPGETVNFSAGSITFETFVPWINLQIVNDPGKGYALYGAIAAILGLLASLFGRRRRMWIRITSSGVVEVAGLAKNGAPGLEEEIASLTAHMRDDTQCKQLGHIFLITLFIQRWQFLRSLS